LGEKTRADEQQKNMNAAGLMQPDFQNEPDNQSEYACNPEHGDIMLRKL
jgi:hypothetical protein